MKDAVPILGEYILSDTRKVLMNEQLLIPGLHLFGWDNFINAESPLVPHYHENLFEITYIARGVFSFSADDSDYKLTGGDVFITKPGEVHSTNLTPMSVGEIYWFLLDSTKSNNILFLDQTASQDLLQNLYRIPGHLISTGTSEMLSLLKKSFQAALTCKDPYTSSAYLVLFLRRLLKYSTTTEFRLTPDIGKALDFIFDHIYGMVTIEELADSCNLSVSRFKHKFKQQMGLSPRNFINLQKIELAKGLLAEEDNITNIAMKLGFTTSSYFSTVFKRFTMYTPQEYKNTLKD